MQFGADLSRNFAWSHSVETPFVFITWFSVFLKNLFFCVWLCIVSGFVLPSPFYRPLSKSQSDKCSTSSATYTCENRWDFFHWTSLQLKPFFHITYIWSLLGVKCVTFKLKTVHFTLKYFCQCLLTFLLYMRVLSLKSKEVSILADRRPCIIPLLAIDYLMEIPF